jgi:hypothetical protein
MDSGRIWEDATLAPGPAPFEKAVWTGWYTWTSKQAGRHLIQARATDGDGNRQGEEQDKGILAGVHNGISAIHQVSAVVVE